MNRTSGTYGTIKQSLTFMFSEFPEERRKQQGWEGTQRYSKSGKRHKPTDQTTEQTINRINSKKSCQDIPKFNFQKLKRKNNSWKQPEKNDTLFIRETSLITANFSAKTTEARRSGTMFLIIERKELSTHNLTQNKNKGALNKC